jgi:uncharacterized protein YyaL (SSP411 family)
MANRLSGTTSPYLLQHADNPVDWWPWSAEAFTEASNRDVPVFLSVGYAACHWCHVMAHESFEDEAVAGYLNEHFVAIKVDREERPDVDSLYMQATTMLTGHGGWPMSVFLDPNGRPFHAGTYFPPVAGPAGPSFDQVLQSISNIWRTNRSRVEEVAADVSEKLGQLQTGSANVSGLTEVLDSDDYQLQLSTAADHAAEEWIATWDRQHGGFGSAPKFPPAMTLEFLLRHHARTQSQKSLDVVGDTCEAMARGGLYDQIGGGFARYSVDESWQVPHFEKMLYDNAMLISVYLHWWRSTGSPLAERIVRDSVGFLLLELRTAERGFASSLDADSTPTVPEQNPEGAFYTWSSRQLIEVLGRRDGRWAAKLLGVTRSGTFENGASVLQLRLDPEDTDRWLRIRDQLAAAREQRPRPGRDDKVVAAWNGMAIRALAEAGLLLDEPGWITAAEAAAELLVTTHLSGSGAESQLQRTSRGGVAGSSLGVLEDYTALAHGLLTLAQVTGDERWLNHALDLLDTSLTHFVDSDQSLHDTDDRGEQLLHRLRDVGDNALPSGTTSALLALQTSAAITGDEDHRAAASRILSGLLPVLSSHPRHLPWGLAGLEAAIAGPVQVAIVTPPETTHPDAPIRTALTEPAQAAIATPSFRTSSQELLRVALAGTSPGLVAFGGPYPAQSPAILRDRPCLEDRPTAYVCRNFTCHAPTTDIAELARQSGARPDFVVAIRSDESSG